MAGGFRELEEASAVRTVLAPGSPARGGAPAIAGRGVAGKAVAASDQYIVHPMGVVVRGHPRGPDRYQPDQRVGARRQRDLTVVDVQQLLEYVHAVSRDGRGERARRPRQRRPDGNRVRRRAGGVPDHRRQRQLHLRHRVRHGPGLAATPGPPAEVRFTAADGAIYKGLAIAGTGAASQLFAADFHNGKIDVSTTRSRSPGRRAVRRSEPARRLRAVQRPAIGSRLFVTYAKQDADREDDSTAPASATSTPSTTTARCSAASPRTARSRPVGSRPAPATRRFGGDLLVGNFGDGRINAYKETAPNTWTADGTLKGLDGNPLAIQGLWALEFGGGAANSGPTTTLFFTAGPAAETQGEFGRIQANPLGVGGTVPATLALTLGSPSASFGTFTPGVAADYMAAETADVLSTAGNGTLSVADPDTANPGHLVNGTFVMAQALQADATSPAGTGGAFAPVGGANAPTTLLTYTGPVSHDPVTVNFKQPVAANDPLRTGTYAKTLTFTLSTTQP